jgi:hypothetical protein
MHKLNIKRCPCRPVYPSYTSAGAVASKPGVIINQLQHNAALQLSLKTKYTQNNSLIVTNFRLLKNKKRKLAWLYGSV